MKRFFLLPILFVSAMMLLADFNEALTYFNATEERWQAASPPCPGQCFF